MKILRLLIFSLAFVSLKGLAGGNGFAWSLYKVFTERTLTGNYSFNSSGQDIKIWRNGPGLYRVTFYGIGSNASHRGHVQVSAYGDDNNQCMVSRWNPSYPNFSVEVICFNPSGQRSDSLFSIAVRNPEERQVSYAYALAHNPGAAQYEVDDNYAASPGEGVSITRNGPGNYSVRFKYLSAYMFKGGNAQVTAVGERATYCQPHYWKKDGTDLLVHVKCFGRNANALDSKFLVHFSTQNFNAEERMSVAYAWGSKPSEASYLAPGEYSYPSAQITRANTGSYRVSFAGIGNAVAEKKSHVQVSGYGPNPSSCKSRYWRRVGSNAEVMIDCYDKNGSRLDSQFSVNLLYDNRN